MLDTPLLTWPNIKVINKEVAVKLQLSVEKVVKIENLSYRRINVN